MDKTVAGACFEHTVSYSLKAGFDGVGAILRAPPVSAVGQSVSDGQDP